jgi:AraC family transcriptional regulator
MQMPPQREIEKPRVALHNTTRRNPCGIETPPIAVPLPNAGNHATRLSSAEYDSALARVGGCRMEAKPSIPSSELVVALYESPQYDLTVAPMDTARLSINLTSVPVFGAIASARSRSYSGRRYSIFYAPTGSDAHWSKPRPSQHLNIYFRIALIEELADGPTALLKDDRPLFDVHVHRIRPWIDALELSLGERGASADDASLGLAHLIVASIARLPGRPTPTLSAAELVRVRDYIAAYLGEPIRIADLAVLTDLSVGRFAQRFLASTGVPPHRFILNRRVEAAMDLLRKGPLPMAEVAAACGFCSQQHMATVMRRLIGVAPSSVRAPRPKDRQ